MILEFLWLWYEKCYSLRSARETRQGESYLNKRFTGIAIDYCRTRLYSINVARKQGKRRERGKIMKLYGREEKAVYEAAAEFVKAHDIVGKGMIRVDKRGGDKSGTYYMAELRVKSASVIGKDGQVLSASAATPDIISAYVADFGAELAALVNGYLGIETGREFRPQVEGKGKSDNIL